MAKQRYLKRYSSAFTIVELLVVIVVIGVLAAITIVSYSSISNRAIVASIKSDLSNASKTLKLFHAENSGFPATVTNCNVRPDSVDNKCIKLSPNNSSEYYVSISRQSFVLFIRNGVNVYQISENSEPIAWVVVGSQVWAPTNSNVGTMISGTEDQTNEGAGSQVIQKYCHQNNESNCTTYGGLYQWGEAMEYSTTQGSRGICSLGSHIPTYAEMSTLVATLGGGSAAADALKAGGSSGLGFSYAGYRGDLGQFYGITSSGFYMTSRENGSNVDVLYITNSSVSWPPQSKTRGMSVRCIKD